jgi:hypothetical protein
MWHGSLAWRSSQCGILAKHNMTATPAYDLESSILVAMNVSLLWIWLTDVIPEGIHFSLIRHCFVMCSLEMIRILIKISQWTQSIESPLNSSNSWVCCSTNNLTTSNHGITHKVHNMYYDFISIQVTKSFSELYHWISPILLSANYWTLSPHIPFGTLHQDCWCWVSA